jgi:hypothetical protein
MLRPMHTLGNMAKVLNRPAVVLARIRDRFEIPAAASSLRFALCSESPAEQTNCGPRLQAAAEA